MASKLTRSLMPLLATVMAGLSSPSAPQFKEMEREVTRRSAGPVWGGSKNNRPVPRGRHRKNSKRGHR